MRLTVMGQMAKGLRGETSAGDGDQIEEHLERIKWYLWHGSVLWLPDVEGSYEVHAKVVDAADAVIAIGARRVTVNPNSLPSVTISTTMPTPSATEQVANFDTTFSFSGADQEIARVEFYDNGELMGIDYIEPFGDVIDDLFQDDPATPPPAAPVLRRGMHSITAIAYDCRGIRGPISQPIVVDITGGNASPECRS
jgi:hypothetical protein